MPNVRRVLSIAVATSHLPFKPVASAGFLSKARIFVSFGPPFRFHALDLMVDDPSLGRFQITEVRSQATQAELESLARRDHAQGCRGDWRIVTIRGRTRALFITGGPSTSVDWLRHGVRYSVSGPSETFSGDDAVAAANEL